MPSSIRRIGLTGGIASGKTLAGQYLESKGIPVIDADAVVHDLLQNDPTIQGNIRKHFGDVVFDETGAVNRQALGAQVFSNPEQRQLLESWIHPAVRQRVESFYQAHSQEALGVALIPLLFESRLEALYDEVWLIAVDQATQLKRLTEHRGMSSAEALARIQSQMPLAEKQQCLAQHTCGRLLLNEGSPEALYRQLDALLP